MNAIALSGTPLSSRVARHFFVHSGHVPLVLLILEALLARPGYFARADGYLLLAAGIGQAWLAETMALRGRPRPVVANLSGPLVYTAAEVLLEGPAFFQQWHHQAYWVFAAGFALLQTVQQRRPRAALPVLAENVWRAAIPLAMYALFEARIKGTALSPTLFFADRAHDFLAIVLLLLGVLLGFADINLRRSMHTVQALTARLRQFSEWSMGRDMLDRAIADDGALALQRVARAVLFMDIRGFTAWSETQSPEAVVRLLHRYYRAAEQALADAPPIKLKFTADEIMAVFADAPQAVAAGQRLPAATSGVLSDAALGAGAGVHLGPVVEGLIGGEGTRAYDFIGDTVNTAQRLCDAAAAGELLVSQPAAAAAGTMAGAQRVVQAKGKREPLLALVLRPLAGTQVSSPLDAVAPR